MCDEEKNYPLPIRNENATSNNCLPETIRVILTSHIINGNIVRTHPRAAQSNYLYNLRCDLCGRQCFHTQRVSKITRLGRQFHSKQPTIKFQYSVAENISFQSGAIFLCLKAQRKFRMEAGRSAAKLALCLHILLY